MGNKVTRCVNAIGLVALVVVLSVGCRHGDLMVIADDQTRVFKEYPENGPPQQDKVIAVLQVGEACEVIHARYSKDFMFYKVRLKSGQDGYVWVGDKFRVVPKK